MKRLIPLAALTLTLPALAADYPPAPAEIVAAAPKAEWTAIDPADLLVMDLAPDRDGNARRVVIQLMPAPLSQGWVDNIRKLAAAHWWDGMSVYRVQDNYVVQWGDVAEQERPLEGLKVMLESEYGLHSPEAVENLMTTYRRIRVVRSINGLLESILEPPKKSLAELRSTPIGDLDPYGPLSNYWHGWPLATDIESHVWPIHCYGMVGVARGTEDTGMGTDLYTVIGHAPRQLDRNIALVGRVIEGIEHLSSLPRGKGELGFYEDDEAEKRVPILSVRLGPEASGLPGFEYLSTDSASFAAYAHARANRQDAFYKVPAGGADICNVPVPIRRIAG